MRTIKEKLQKKEGFTLAELLIVVAIIAVLVAVSIPIFTSKLEKAREATDIANMRAAKAAAVVLILDDDTENDDYKALISDTGIYYDAQKGVLTTTAPTGYGKGTATDGTGYTADNNEYKYVSTTSYASQYITVKYSTKNETFTYSWAK